MYCAARPSSSSIPCSSSVTFTRSASRGTTSSWRNRALAIGLWSGSESCVCSQQRVAPSHRGDCGRGDDAHPGLTSSCERSSPLTEASNQPNSARRQGVMKTAVAPNVRPDRSESGDWPTLVPDLPDGAREAIDARYLDPIARRKDRLRAIRRSHARTSDRIGSLRRPDPRPDDRLSSLRRSAPKEARSGLTPTTTPPRAERSGPTPTTTRPEEGSTGRLHLEAVSFIDIAYPGVIDTPPLRPRSRHSYQPPNRRTKCRTHRHLSRNSSRHSTRPTPIGGESSSRRSTPPLHLYRSDTWISREPSRSTGSSEQTQERSRAHVRARRADRRPSQPGQVPVAPPPCRRAGRLRRL